MSTNSSAVAEVEVQENSAGLGLFGRGHACVVRVGVSSSGSMARAA